MNNQSNKHNVSTTHSPHPHTPHPHTPSTDSPHSPHPHTPHTPAARFLQALKTESPLQIIGTINPYIALMAKELGYRALYLSGAGIANMSHGIPDIGLTTLDDVFEDARRITSAVDLPLLVDIDTGWDIPTTIQKMIEAKVAAIQIEDQITDKRCGHLEGKSIISTAEMVKRLKTAIKARGKNDLLIMARTDAYAIEGLEQTIARAIAYRDAGADLLFPEALSSLSDYQAIKQAVNIPILANLTEFGKTPLYTLSELATAQVDMALYPLSAARAMNLAAFKIMETIRKKGTQKESLKDMQTREELYHFLGYTPNKGGRS